MAQQRKFVTMPTIAIIQIIVIILILYIIPIIVLILIIVMVNFPLRYLLIGATTNWINEYVATKPGLQPIEEVKNAQRWKPGQELPANVRACHINALYCLSD